MLNGVFSVQRGGEGHNDTTDTLVPLMSFLCAVAC